MDVANYIEYWSNGGLEDLDVAQQLIHGKRWRQGLFIAFWSLEKMLKANVAKTGNGIAPRTQNLSKLAELTHIDFSEAHRKLLRDFQDYNIEGLYPDLAAPPLDPGTVQRQFVAVSEIVHWLKNQL